MKRLDAKQEARGRGEGGCVLVVRPLGTPQMWVTLQLLAGGCQRNDPLLAKALEVAHMASTQEEPQETHTLPPRHWKHPLEEAAGRGGKFVGYPAVVVDGVIA